MQGIQIMDSFQGKLMTPAAKAAVVLFTGTVLILACYAPAIAQQKENSRYEQFHSNRPAIIQQGTFSYLA
jgi:hypothetical protein